MIKVLHVIIGLNIGGSELMLQRLISGSLGDVDHAVICLTEKGQIGNELMDLGVPVYSLGFSGLLTLPACFFKLLRIISRLNPDVVHTWMYHSDLLGGLAAFFLGKRNIIWCVRSTNINLAGSKATVLIRYFCALISSFIPKKIVYAAQASRLVHEKIGYSRKKSLVFPNGFVLDRFRQFNNYRFDVRSELSVENQEELIGVVGRYHPVKDYKTMIAAFEALARRRPNAKIVMIGRGLERSNEEFYSLVEGSEFLDRFILLGQRPDVPRLMQALDLFCLHSISEGFPNVLGEAMLSGLPCVTTDVGDAAYLLGARDFVSAPRDVKALADNLDKVLSLSSDQRFAVGARNRKRIVDDFSLDKIVDMYRELYIRISS